jgi:hypothetical protein
VAYEFAGKKFKDMFHITDLGDQQIILGMPWLESHNPLIDWRRKTIVIPKDPSRHIRAISKTVESGDSRSRQGVRPLRAATQDHGETCDGEDAIPTGMRSKIPLAETVEETTGQEHTMLMHSQAGESEVVRAATQDPRKDQPRTSIAEVQEVADIMLRALFLTTQETLLTTPAEESEKWIRVKQSTSQKFAQEAEDTSAKVVLPPEYQEFTKVFKERETGKLPERRPWDHAINLKPDFKPMRKPHYQMGFEDEERTMKWIHEMKAKGFIRPTNSPMTSPLFWIEKKTKEEFRPCQDYRHLNDGTIKDAYNLPLISDLLLRLRQYRLFTKMDVRWGYNNVRIKEGDEWKAAFSTPFGAFEPTVMFFGLCNSPSTFQRMMNEYFWDYISEGWVVIYMDDILICAEDRHQLRERTKKILHRMREKDLFLALKKCKFEQEEIDFLGMIIRYNQIRMDGTKLKGIKTWPEPKTVKDVRSFLGFCNFYRKFIGHYAEISKPLTELTKKDEPFVWNEIRQEAFDTLKSKFLEEPVLVMPDPMKQFILQTDASKIAIGAVLKQYSDDGELHPCGYLSHTLTEAEKNYQVYDRELLAVLAGLRTWKKLLKGSCHAVILHTDHKNLGFYKEHNKMTDRQMRWHAELMEYNLNWEWIPGTKNIQADVLSRRSDHRELDDEQDEKIMPPLITNDRIIAQLYEEMHEEIAIRTILPDLKDEIVSSTKLDKFALDIRKHIKDKTTPFKSSLKDWEIKDDLILYQHCVYVPPGETRRAILKLYHDTPITGHPGIMKTTELVTKDYWWPGIRQYIKNYLKGCGLCQQMKVNTHPANRPLLPIKSEVEYPFQQVTCDFITDLLPSNGFDSIMVVVDHGLSKGVVYIPCNKTVTAEQTAQLYIDHVWKRYGFPKIFISDRGPQFSSIVFKEICQTMKIDQRMSTAFHPQTDGETERVNQELETYLRMFCALEPEQWGAYLPMAEFAHNARVHEATKRTPFQVIYGTDPIGIPTALPRYTAPAAEDKAKELIRIRQETLSARELARRVMEQRSQIKIPAPLFKDQRVWLNTTNIKLPYTRKLKPKREGPFKVLDQLGKYTYRIELPKTWKIHPVFDRWYLTPYIETDEYGENYPQPPPDIIDGHQEYEIEQILKQMGKGRTLRYYVKWKGYSTQDNSWVKAVDLTNADELLEEFKKRKNLA